jgi:hypothetical protein
MIFAPALSVGTKQMPTFRADDAVFLKWTTSVSTDQAECIAIKIFNENIMLHDNFKTLCYLLYSS